MANTKAAKKAIRQSKNKKEHNLFWKRRIKSHAKLIRKMLETKNADADILNKEVNLLQKALDKATKHKVIHKNKANRLKARFAKKIAAHEQKPESKSTKSKSKS